MGKTLNPVMLTVAETAKVFGISEYYARQLAMTSTVNAVRVGTGRGKILINAESVQNYFNSARLNEAS